MKSIQEPPLVIVMDVSSSCRGRDRTVFISLKLVLVCRALIRTTRDMSVSGSGLIKRQSQVRGRPRERSDSFTLIKAASWAGLCFNCLLLSTCSQRSDPFSQGEPMDFFHERLPHVKILQLYASVEGKYKWLWWWLINRRGSGLEQWQRSSVWTRRGEYL